MTGSERLFVLLGQVDSTLVEEAAEPRPAAPSRWQKWVGLAACLLLAVGLFRLSPFSHLMGSTAPEENESAASSGQNSAGSTAPDTNENEASPADTEPAFVLSPITGEPISLISRGDEGLFLLCGGQELALSVPEAFLPDPTLPLSRQVQMAVNTCPEGADAPVSFENYVMLTFINAAGERAYMAVGINAEGAFLAPPEWFE